MKKKIKFPNEDDTAFYDHITKLECTILDKVALMKKNKTLPICSHFVELDDFADSYNKHANYYEKFWKLYLTTELCNFRIHQIENCLRTFEKDVSLVEVNGSLIKNLMEKRDYELKKRIKKKSRRKAQQIEKPFACPHANCYKEYGSEISLKLHIRLKHSKEYSDHKMENSVFEEENQRSY